MLRFFECTHDDVAVLGASETQLLLDICRRLNQAPPATMFPRQEAWSTKHKARWQNHERSLAKLPITIVDVDDATQTLENITVQCLRWDPDARPLAASIASELHASNAKEVSNASAAAVYQPRPETELEQSFATSVPKSTAKRPASPTLQTPCAKAAVHAASASASKQMPTLKRLRVNSKSSEPPAVASTPRQPESTCAAETLVCACKSQNCRSTAHARGQACTHPCHDGSLYCSSCKCLSDSCAKLRRLGCGGYCGGCSINEIPWTMQLVRKFGELDLLGHMTPVDVEALLEMHKALVEKFGRADPALIFIASWAKDPTFIKQLHRDPPSPNCSSLELQKHIHKALQGAANKHLVEAGCCIRGGRHTGLLFCLRWLGLACKVGKGDQQDFKGGIPFVPFKPQRFIENIGGQKCKVELGRSSDGLDALIKGLRGTELLGGSGAPLRWETVQKNFRASLEAVTKKYSMGLTGNYVAPHVLRKLLLLNGDLPPLTIKEMRELVPDEQKVLDNLPAHLRQRGRLAKTLHCPDIYVTCFNCHSPSQSVTTPCICSFTEVALRT